jgi:nicotinamide riboside transporter PnuC
MTWVLSLLAIVSLYLMGNRNIWGPIIGAVSQFVWLYYSWQTRQYGFIPSVLVLLAVNVRNLIKWRKRNESLRAKGTV